MIENNQRPLAALTDELTIVQAQLEQAVAELYSPFKELAHSQLGRIQPLRRAAVVLATGVDATENATLQQQRIDLATALEMLNIALVIHQLLLSPTANQTDNPNQRSVTGSVILTGDYCFTRSALFAAKTNNVQVVELFSQTLKTISEGILRKLFADRGEAFSPPVADFHTELALCEAGIVGATALVQAIAPKQESNPDQLLAIIRRWVPDWEVDGQDGVGHLIQQLPPPQQERWQTVQQWL